LLHCLWEMDAPEADGVSTNWWGCRAISRGYKIGAVWADNLLSYGIHYHRHWRFILRLLQAERRGVMLLLSEIKTMLNTLNKSRYVPQSNKIKRWFVGNVSKIYIS